MSLFENVRRTLGTGRTLKLQCEACGHRAALGGREAADRCGPDATPMEIRWRARCQACGVQGRVRMWI